MYIDFKPKKYNEFPKPSTREIEIETKRIWEFLKKTHPYIDHDRQKEYGMYKKIDLAIEIRPLRSDQGMFKRYVRPHYIYRFSEDEYQRLLKYNLSLFKQKKKAGECYYMPFCYYFSIYACDNKITAIKADGEPAKTQMAANTAHCTQILSIDLDNITHDEYLKYKFTLSQMANLQTVDFFTGHGYQMHLLLDKPTTDVTALEKWLNAVRKLGIPADEKVSDCSRILRAGFYNSKGVLVGDKNFGTEIYKVEEVATTIERYSIEQAFEQMEIDYTSSKRPLHESRFKGKTADDFINYPYEDKYIGHLPKQLQKDLRALEKAANKDKKMSHVKLENKQARSYEVGQINLKEMYPMIDIDKLPVGVQQMLYGFREGNANNVLVFITLKLRYMGYPASVITQVIIKLSELETFNYDWTANNEYFEAEVKRIYHSEYTNVPPRDFEKLEAEFGELNFKDILAVNKTTIKIPHSLYQRRANEDNGGLSTQIAKITPAAFQLLLGMMIEEHDYFAINNKLKKFNIDELQEITEWRHKDTVRKAVDILVKAKLVDKKTRESKKEGKRYSYYLRKVNLSDGFTSMDVGTLETLLIRVKCNKLSQRSLMIYMYIRFRIQDQEEVTVSQETIAEIFGLTQPRMTQALKELHDKKLLVKVTQGIRSNKYILLR